MKSIDQATNSIDTYEKIIFYILRREQQVKLEVPSSELSRAIRYASFEAHANSKSTWATCATRRPAEHWPRRLAANKWTNFAPEWMNIRAARRRTARSFPSSRGSSGRLHTGFSLASRWLLAGFALAPH